MSPGERGKQREGKMMEAEWEEGMERGNKPDHVSELTAARENLNRGGERCGRESTREGERGDRCSREAGTGRWRERGREREGRNTETDTFGQGQRNLQRSMKK